MCVSVAFLQMSDYQDKDILIIILRIIQLPNQDESWPAWCATDMQARGRRILTFLSIV